MPPTSPPQATQTVVPWSVLPAQVVYAREEAAEFGPSDKGGRARAWARRHGRAREGRDTRRWVQLAVAAVGGG